MRGLYTRLTQDGVDAWLDKAKLLPGQDWELEIRKAVREADVVVVCLSKQFNQAGFRQKEVRLALDTAMEKPEGEIFIIPARLEECDNLESLRKWHWVDLFEDDGYEMLMRALRARADKMGATLQINKNWLPKVNAQPTVVKKPSPSVEKPVEKKQEKLKPKKEIQTPRTFNKTVIDITGLVVLVLVAMIYLRPLIGKPEITPTVTNTVSSKTFTPIPASKTKTSTPTFTDVSLLKEITDEEGVEMVLVDEGEFVMGSEATASQSPIHKIYLDYFYIDKYEITNALYEDCVKSTVCTPPQEEISKSRTNYYGDLKYANHPVIYVNWNQAKTYCEWRGADLPTEAQWEKSVRSFDGRTYPWGEGLDCNKANYWSCQWDTVAVGSYLHGVSPNGAYDLTGNVWEWVLDWYSDVYYKSSPYKNPFGPDSGEYR
ncbi:MAG: SUMF1/EgtB/PvdO family nonheme iron enzyme [Anaerolineales bacterium]|nr:SUMF1/EgtB/PvdO family nonheme iron enzyme [Anaerolineales bacterium]